MFQLIGHYQSIFGDQKSADRPPLFSHFSAQLSGQEMLTKYTVDFQDKMTQTPLMESILLVIHIWMLSQHYKMKTIHFSAEIQAAVYFPRHEKRQQTQEVKTASSFFHLSPTACIQGRYELFVCRSQYVKSSLPSGLSTRNIHLSSLCCKNTKPKFKFKFVEIHTRIFIPKFCHSGCAASAALCSPIRRTSGVSSLAAHSAAFLQSWITRG